ncbi:MAG: hypothetical protein VW547_08220 [Alphaproteobacteria bacterium]|jgi:hypothetical protein
METPELPPIGSDKINALCIGVRYAAANLATAVAEARAAIGSDGHDRLVAAAHDCLNVYRRAEQDLLGALTGYVSPAGLLTA